MRYRDRQDAGHALAKALASYKGQDVVILALPRGGVVPAAIIAKELKAPLTLLLAHKIGHPYQPEYAIGAVTEDGIVVTSSHESTSGAAFDAEKERQIALLQKKRQLFLKGKQDPPLEGKIAIIVDDGIATGLTMLAAIGAMKKRKAKKIVIAVPVAPRTTAESFKKKVDDFVCPAILDEYEFMGAIGAHYEDFTQVEDEEVIALLEAQNGR